MSLQKLRVAIIGLNNQGQDHLEAIQQREDVELAATCDTDERFKDAYDGAFYTDYNELFQSGRIDAAIVALPNDLHLDIVTSASKHGIHLLKEKPIARTLAEAHEVAKQAAGAIVLHTGVQRRHHKTYATLHEELQGKMIRSAFLEMTVVPKPPSPNAWRGDVEKAGGGVFIDLGYHAVDLMHFLLGPMDPVSCTAYLSHTPSGTHQTEDEVRVWAKAGSAWVRMMIGRSQEKRERLWVETDNAVYEATRESVIRHQNGEATTLEESNREWTDTLQEQMSAFVAAIAKSDRYRTDPPEQMPTIRFIEQCYGLLSARGLPGDLETTRNETGAKS